MTFSNEGIIALVTLIVAVPAALCAVWKLVHRDRYVIGHF